MFNKDRLKAARQRRKLAGKELADLAGVTAVTISKIENGHQPGEYVVDQIAAALGYPRDFFFMDTPEIPDVDTVSFRSLKRMSSAERHAALTAGGHGVALYEWIEERFNLPVADLPDLSKIRDRPDMAARMLRQHWGIGEHPIADVLKLIEAKGVRVLSLSENTKNVDAYSFWKGERPFIFLNQHKTAERSVFDSAHELAHLVLHQHAGAKADTDAETQADQFASAFLMPDGDVRREMARVYTAAHIVAKKRRWKVSAMALAYRLHKLGMLSDWRYRSICIELGQLGFRSGEPKGIERETSTVLAKVLAAMWGKRMTKQNIATDLNLPLDEIEALIFGLSGHAPIHVGGQRPFAIVGGRHE